MGWLGKILNLPRAVYKAVRDYLDERKANYTFEFDENEVRTLRNGIVVRAMQWGSVRSAVLWLSDAITTDCDNLVLIDEHEKTFALNDYSPNFMSFCEFLDEPFPGFSEISGDYYLSASKSGNAAPLTLELKLGEIAKIVSGNVNN